MIYFNSGSASRWYTVSECLWSSATQIRGRVALNDLYPDLEGFFVGFLGVQELTLDMAYDELKEMGARVPSPSITTIKETIWALNSLLSSAERMPDAVPVFERTIFPVRYPNGSVKLQSGHTLFAIADRKVLSDIFTPRAKTLDFTLDEVRRLQPFLSWLDLESRYLSSSVREISTVAGGRMNKLQNPDREIKQKAEGLYRYFACGCVSISRANCCSRIAVHYNSPRTEDDGMELYHILNGTKVYETDGISSELHLSQDGQSIVHIQEQSELHLREDDDVLNVYVPRDPKTQGFCYFSTLPRRLLEWMMTDPVTVQLNHSGPKAVQIVTAILNAPLINMCQILEAEGIVDVLIPAAVSDTDDDREAGLDDAGTEDPLLLNDSQGAHGSNFDHEGAEGYNQADSGLTIDATSPFLSETELQEDMTPSQEGSFIQQFADIGSPPRLSDLPIRQKSPATPTPSLTGRQLFTPTSSTSDYFDQNRQISEHRRHTPTTNSMHIGSTGAEQTTSAGASHPAFVFGSSPSMQSSSAFQFESLDGTTLHPTIDDEGDYLNLISNVISAATKADFPSRGTYGMSGLFNAMPEVDEAELSQRFRTHGPRERDMRVGALGELYVS